MRSPMLRSMARPQARPFTSTLRALSTTTIRKADRVQTPIQSIPKKKVVPEGVEPEAGSGPVQTPVQTQIPSQVTPDSQPQVDQIPPPQAGGQLNRTRPLLYMTFGLTGVAVFSYFYYGYRKEHMDRKWAAMQEEARQNVRNRSG